MRILLLSSLLFSLQAFAQIQGDGQFELGGTPTGMAAKMNLGFHADNNIKLSGSIGNTNDRVIGSVDVTMQDEQAIGGSRKFKLITGWTMINFDKTALSSSIDALLKLKLGAVYNKSKISYSISPVSFFSDLNGGEQRQTMAHGLEAEQKIGNYLKIAGRGRYASIYSPNGKYKDGNSKKARGEVQFTLPKNKDITVLAFYEVESYDYKSIDNSTLSTVDHKQRLPIVGVGVKGYFGGYNNAKSH